MAPFVSGQMVEPDEGTSRPQARLIKVHLLLVVDRQPPAPIERWRQSSHEMPLLSVKMIPIRRPDRDPGGYHRWSRGSLGGANGETMSQNSVGRSGEVMTKISQVIARV